ncbi:MAG: lytic transglycosylase domain-containing protein [Williamsia sp.]|nr:lytic transglycosylase domain-containing protein [Williamsia sp.]
MNKLVSLTVAIFLYAGMQASGQPKAVVSSSVEPIDTFSHKNNLAVPAIVKPASNLLVDFKDLFQLNAVGSGEGPTLNPRAVSFVQDYISKYGKALAGLKEWSRPFFNMMDAVFIQNGLPCELKYLAMIESRLTPTAVSWAGAVGPWQFMPATAIRMGLKVNRRIDERTNYIKSTQAAARYLTELYDQFGDWLLVIAAYNGGPGNVLKAMRRSGSRDFWDIQYYLPAESRNHVKKFISTHYIFEGQGGLTTLTRAESEEHFGSKGQHNLNRNLNEEERGQAKMQLVTGKFHSSVIARNIGMELNEFNRYNPQFDKIMAGSANTYDLLLPADKMELFNSVKYKILSESVELLLKQAAFNVSAAPIAGTPLAGKE